MSIELKITQGVISYNAHKVLEVGNLSFKSGKIYQIKGDNGSGKTSFFRAIVNMKAHFSGEIYINDKVISKLHTNEILTKISFVPQDRNAFSRLTINQHIKLINNRQLLLNEYYEKAFNYLGDKLQKGHNLSGGQAKLLLLMLNISYNPEIILLDEPFAGLDNKSKSILIDILDNWHNSKKCIIYTDHSSLKFNDNMTLELEPKNNKFKLASNE